MSDNTLLIVVGGGLAAWYLFMRNPVAPVATAPQPYPYQPAYNPYANVAGYQQAPNAPSDPGDTNSWLPSLITTLGGLGNTALQFGLQSSVQNASGPATSSGGYSGGGSYGLDASYTDYGGGSDYGVDLTWA